MQAIECKREIYVFKNDKKFPISYKILCIFALFLSRLPFGKKSHSSLHALENALLVFATSAWGNC